MNTEPGYMIRVVNGKVRHICESCGLAISHGRMWHYEAHQAQGKTPVGCGHAQCYDEHGHTDGCCLEPW